MIKCQLKEFVPNGLINDFPAVVQTMAWRRTGDTSLTYPILSYITGANMRHSASAS